MRIVISSGKGGTGKTLISSNLAASIGALERGLRYLDCDVEAPNSHFFITPKKIKTQDVELSFPHSADPNKCTACGKCAEICSFGAVAQVGKEVLFFPEMCHGCDACSVVCPENAVVYDKRKIGQIHTGRIENIDYIQGELRIGEVSTTPELIEKVFETKVSQSDMHTDGTLEIIDSPPGTSCPVVETVKHADLCVLVSDDTPFSLTDLALSVEMCRSMDVPIVVFHNRKEQFDNDVDPLKQYCREEEIEIIGTLPDDKRIAEAYSRGKLVIDAVPEYTEYFKYAWHRIKAKAGEMQTPPFSVSEPGIGGQNAETSTEKTRRRKTVRLNAQEENLPVADDSTVSDSSDWPEIVVISGKGGTGKTSIAGCFSVMADKAVIADCDVDASDLFCILSPKIKDEKLFSGGTRAVINPEQCTACGICAEECRFDAILPVYNTQGRITSYKVSPGECEGCNLCKELCPVGAISMQTGYHGKIYQSETKAGPMMHARMFPGEENSGKLVTSLKKRAYGLTDKTDGVHIVDGSPGIGCPVVSSLSGANYAVIVTEPTLSGVHDMERVLKVTQHFSIPSGVIVNKADLNTEIAESIEERAAKYGARLLGELPFAPGFKTSQLRAESLVELKEDELAIPENRKAVEAIELIWKNLMSYAGKPGSKNTADR